MVLTHGIACNGAYKRLRILHCKVGLEVSGEASVGRIGQGFDRCLMKFHWLGFSLDLGFSRLNIVFMFMICCWLFHGSFIFISLRKLFIIPAVNS